MKQNGHANGVMEKGGLKHVEGPFFDASETMRSSTPAVMEQATPEKQGLGSLKLLASGGLKTSRLSQVSCASATEAPDSEPNGSLAKPLNVTVTDTPGSQLSGKSLKVCARWRLQGLCM
ncbi:hypothetical protein DUNSADRAFT_2080 [Dunaliella salina]|uniref:Encoded protein n=1 Tax=Dunaliella salina TaxID=3046 RepID=A0ABQ7FWP8_DUNSA|nr:hypothetical protein DUNSADRAFT_2080 [Dunaliella salina]|eukprot:KAF5826766.1 hypothetical protein DUNSADRAFT_2080 [Dunaliella salina]